MNNSIQNKLLDHEVNPPEAAWERIAVELADINLSNKISPAFANTEVTPPEGTWNKIAAALDDDYFTETIAAKLATAEASPPAGAWKTIEVAINISQQVTPVIKGKFFPFWKYAAAAVVTSALAWGSITLINYKNKTEGISSAYTKTDTDNSHQNTETGDINTTDPATTNSTAATTAEDEIRNDAALEASKRVYASVDVPKLKSRISNAANFYFAPDDALSMNVTSGNLQPDAADENSLSDRYYMMITTEGKVIRMSKKLGHLACCISGEDHDTECVNQLKRWQEKLAKQPGTHSPGNFSDLLDLVCALEEK